MPLQPRQRERDQFLLTEAIRAITHHPYRLAGTGSLKGYSVEYLNDAATEVDSVVKDAEILPSARFGGIPVLSSPEVFTDQPNALVVRMRVTINLLMQERTVVVKQIPRTTDDVDPTVLRGVVTYQFVDTLPDGIRPGLQLLAYDISKQLLVLSGVGVVKILADVPFRGDEERRLRTLRSLDASLGRTYIHTYTHEGRFETLRRRMRAKSKVNHEAFEARDHGIMLGIRFGTRVTEGSGIPVPDTVRLFGEDAARRTKKGMCRVFASFDFAPNDILLVDKVQLLDYEWAGYHDVAFDVTSVVAGFPLHAFVERPPEAEVDMFARAWMERIRDHWYRGISDRRLMVFTVVALLGWFLTSATISFFGPSKQALWVRREGCADPKPEISGSALEWRDMANATRAIAQLAHRCKDDRAGELEQFAYAVIDFLEEEEGQGARDGSE